ncbi:MAG: acyl-CoA dehydrogenase family protein [Microthrixaceae bacterium]
MSTFQNSRFKLAEMSTEITIAETFVDRCLIALNDGQLTAEEASMVSGGHRAAKRVADTCLQLHGSYGYMVSTRSPVPTPIRGSPRSTESTRQRS